jgi:undecaprenyl-diphosphatase
VLNLATATVLAGVAGYASIAFLLHFLKTHTTYVFVVYRLIAGSLILWALSRGILQDQPPV